MNILINILITLAAFTGMEAVAWFTHKYVMHGILWIWHKDHHHKESPGFFEHNDYFFLIFAIPGIIGIFLGVYQNFSFWFFICCFIIQIFRFFICLCNIIRIGAHYFCIHCRLSKLMEIFLFIFLRSYLSLYLLSELALKYFIIFP